MTDIVSNNLKSHGFCEGYHYEYAIISSKDVIKTYKNSVRSNENYKAFEVKNNRLPPAVLK